MSMRMPDDPFVVQLPSHERDRRMQDLRTAWREACVDLRLAYLDWREARAAHTHDAFAAYVAAVDRESAAAEVFCRHVANEAIAA
jgi:hypothetical protein